MPSMSRQSPDFLLRNSDVMPLTLREVCISRKSVTSRTRSLSSDASLSWWFSSSARSLPEEYQVQLVSTQCKVKSSFLFESRILPRAHLPLKAPNRLLVLSASLISCAAAACCLCASLSACSSSLLWVAML